jgi:aryl-alcohol dehydrogenase-like predicted oxidoreductase
MAWLLHNPMVTAPIMGPRTTKQLKEWLRALDMALSDETLEKLDEIWPGPRGEAPQAYAW